MTWLKSGIYSLAAVVAMGITAAINWRLQRDFAREWVASFRVKHMPRSVRTSWLAWRGSRNESRRNSFLLSTLRHYPRPFPNQALAASSKPPRRGDAA